MRKLPLLSMWQENARYLLVRQSTMDVGGKQFPPTHCARMKAFLLAPKPSLWSQPPGGGQIALLSQ